MKISIDEIKNVSTDYEYDEMYRISELCSNQLVMDNIFNFLRLRESLAVIFNKVDLSRNLKTLWIQNILIVTAAIVEALLQESFGRLKYICQLQNNKCQSCGVNIKLLNKEISRTNFTDLIKLAEQYGMLQFSSNLVDELRKLRNNIHISNSKKILDEDDRLVANYANSAFEIFDHVVISLHKFFQFLENGCLKEKNNVY